MDKNCGNCFFKDIKDSTLAPCWTCKYDPLNVTISGNAHQAKAWLKDRWVTDSDQFWKDTVKGPVIREKDPYEVTLEPGGAWPFPVKPGQIVPVTEKELSAFKSQVGGGHYKGLKIQPVEYIHANGIPFIEGNIIKYITRWRDKGGKADLEKVKHFVDLLIELEFKDEASDV